MEERGSTTKIPWDMGRFSETRDGWVLEDKRAECWREEIVIQAKYWLLVVLFCRWGAMMMWPRWRGRGSNCEYGLRSLWWQWVLGRKRIPWVSDGFRWSQEGHETGVTWWENASYGGESTPTEEQFAVVDRRNFLSGISKKEASVGTNYVVIVVVQWLFFWFGGLVARYVVFTWAAVHVETVSRTDTKDWHHQ